MSKAAARQRRGRAGRVQPGHCFHLFTRHQLEKMADYQVPEMLRTPLEELILQLKILGLGEAQPFLQRAIEPPTDRAVQTAIDCLRELVLAIVIVSQVAHPGLSVECTGCS